MRGRRGPSESLQFSAGLLHQVPHLQVLLRDGGDRRPMGASAAFALLLSSTNWMRLSNTAVQLPG